MVEQSMSKKRIAIFSVISILVFAIIFTIIFKRQYNSQKITFAECEIFGGTAWLVDRYHPDICPSCAEYLACEIEFNDYSEACPDCYGPCQTCQDEYSLYESCPSCYGPCQECQNKYFNDFKNDEERIKLCPECEICDNCREELNLKIMNCTACISCNTCKEKNKKYSNISDVCPQTLSCAACMESTGIYPDRCPDGMEKIGEISDAAIWFQCCK
jgi:hypothetical protein